MCYSPHTLPQDLLCRPPAAHLGFGAGLWIIILCAVLLARARAHRLAPPCLALLLHGQPHQHSCFLLHLIPAALETTCWADRDQRWGTCERGGRGGDSVQHMQQEAAVRRFRHRTPKDVPCSKYYL